MLQEQVIPIDFNAGLDTKTDPKGVVAGKFLRSENIVWTNPKQFTKRNGYKPLASWTAPQLAHSYNGELLVADQGQLYSYSPSISAAKSKGIYISVDTQRQSIDQFNEASGFADVAVLGNYALYGWSNAYASGIIDSSVFSSVVDMTTGMVISGGGNTAALQTGAAFNVPVRCIVLGGTQLAIIYAKADNSAIYLQTVTISGSTVTYGAQQTLTSGYSPSIDVAAGPGFDICPTPTGGAIFYLTEATGSITGVAVSTISTSGVASAPSTLADTSADGPVSIGVNTLDSNKLFVYWTDATYVDGLPTARSIKYNVYTSTLGSSIGETSVATIAAPYFVSNMVNVTSAANAQTLYYGVYESVGGSSYIDDAWSVITTDAGVVSLNAVWARGIMPLSQPKSVTSINGTGNYAVFLYRGGNLVTTGNFAAQIQPTYFVLQLGLFPQPPYAVARFGNGAAQSLATFTQIVGYSPSLASISASKIAFACSIETQNFLNVNGIDFPTASPTELAATFGYTFDFQNANAYRAVNSGQLAILNGGVVQAYDGVSVTEWGFHLFPEITYAAIGSGEIAAGTYDYLAIFQWPDGQGNLHQSTASITLSVVVPDASSSVELNITCAFLSQKTNVAVSLYRTIGAGGITGSIYYLVTNPIFLNSAVPTGASATITITDPLADASITGNPQAYTYPASAVLENSTPPPSMFMVAHNNRLWFLNSENQNEIWYTKSWSQGTGLSPSALMLDEIDPKLGNIQALGEMDDKLIAFKSEGFAVQAGDGVNDTGNGSTLTNPQFIPADTGCSNQKSVILTPNGILAQTPNGIYRLDRALNWTYAGMDVEGFNSEAITDATLVPGKSQIRFLTSSGNSIVFDYIFNKWGIFTNHGGTSATAWQGTYVYATSGGAIYQEQNNPASPYYLDNGTAFAWLIQTSWLAFAGIQGFQRIKRFILLGDYVNGSNTGHGVQVQTAYDFVSSFGSAVQYFFGAQSSSGTFQVRSRTGPNPAGIVIEKCDAVSLIIQEVTTGQSAEYMDLTNMSFEAGIKKGVNKLSARQTIG